MGLQFTPTELHSLHGSMITNGVALVMTIAPLQVLPFT